MLSFILSSVPVSNVPVFVLREVSVPSFIVVNLPTDSYFLPSDAVETEQQLLDFLDGVLDGSVEVRTAGRTVLKTAKTVWSLNI